MDAIEVTFFLFWLLIFYFFSTHTHKKINKTKGKASQKAFAQRRKGPSIFEQRLLCFP